MDWDKLRVFHAVAEAGSFTQAGSVLNLSQSAISRQIAALENDLRQPLFHRHARGLVLTEQGEILFKTAHDMSSKLAMTEALIGESKEFPSGELRVAATVGGSTWLTPRLAEFLSRYPRITIDLIVTNQDIDLSMREADVTVMFQRPTQPDIVFRQLQDIGYYLFAAKSYIARHGMPTSPEDLDNHKLIVYGGVIPRSTFDINWVMSLGATHGKKRDPVIKVNNIFGVQMAIRSGIGIGTLPFYMAADQEDIVQVLPEIAGPVSTPYFAYPQELRNSKRLGVFRDFLMEKVEEMAAEGGDDIASTSP